MNSVKLLPPWRTGRRVSGWTLFDDPITGDPVRYIPRGMRIPVPARREVSS